jgi:sterol carrier protein 2
MPEPQVFIAGIGLSSSSTWASSTTTRDGFEELALSAAIKALLDAGITYDKVTHGIGCVNDAGTRVGDKPFYALGATGIPICEVDSDAGLYTAASLIRGNGAGCVLLIGPDEVCQFTRRRICL